MGATVNCRVDVGIISTIGEEPIYVMWGEYYEKNCYPHTPRWSMDAIGNWEQFVERTCSIASSAEGGMLQTPKGGTKPETILHRWLTAAKEPLIVNDMTAYISMGKGFYDAIDPNDSRYIRALNWMKDCGYAEIIRRMESGERLALSLRENAHLILGLVSRGVSAWTMFPHNNSPTMGCRTDNPLPTLGKGKWKENLSILSYVRFGNRWDLSALEVRGNRAENPKAQYENIGNFVRNSLPKLIQINPDCFRSAIRLMRESLENAPKAEESGYMFVLKGQPEDGSPSWEISQWKKAANLLGTAPIPCGKVLEILKDDDYIISQGDLYFLEKPSDHEQTPLSLQMTLD